MNEAAVALADILDRENAALRARLPQRVTSLLPAKEAALAALRAGARGVQGGADGPTLRRLLALAAENQTLLAEALAIQTQILGMVARAARAAIARNAPYGRQPEARCRRTPPVSVSRRL